MQIFPESFDVYSLFIDIGFASGFIILGQFLRAKVKFFQAFFVPASLIAGFLGLALGPKGFGLIPFSAQMGRYSGVFIIVVFVSIGLRGFEISPKGIKQDFERIMSFIAYRQFSWGIQYFVPVLFGLYGITKMFPSQNVHPGLGLLLGAGFVGGHGTAAAIGKTFAEYGWADAMDLGMTSATIGILVGIFGGIILIKWATSKGITCYVKDFAELPPELRTGLIPANKQVSMGNNTISPMSLDPLAWHAAFVFLVVSLGIIIAKFVKTRFGLNVPAFSMGFLVSLLFFFVLRGVGVYKYVDKNIISRLGSMATDFLVFFGVASISIPVVLKYIGPFSVLMVVGTILVVGVFLFFSPRMLKDSWFERGIFCFGYLTGVFAIGMALLRIVDPDMKSKTLEDTAIMSATVVLTLTDVTVIALGPILFSTGKYWTFLGPVGAWTFGWLIAAFVFRWWYKLPLARPENKI